MKYWRNIIAKSRARVDMRIRPQARGRRKIEGSTGAFGPVARGLVHDERIQRVSVRNQHILPAVEQIRFWRIRDAADVRVPERLAGDGIKRDEVAAAIAGEQHLP